MDINALGPMLGCQAVIPGMKAAGRGSIINISSIFGLVGEPWVVAYCASKGAVTQLTRSAAVQLAPYGIRVNSVHPTGVDTPMGSGQMQAELGAAMAADQRLGAMFMNMMPVDITEPADVAGTVLFLASDESKFITAHEIAPDAGVTEF